MRDGTGAVAAFARQTAGYPGAVATTETGTVIAERYETGPLLGRGGMAEVYAATDRRLDREVAVKLLLPAMAVRPDVRRRFEAEARAAASLTHANAVAVYDTGEHDGAAFIVMERLPGDTLADRMSAGPVEPDRVRRLAHDVLGALGAAHTAGIVHRDVKPGNILLTTDGAAKIADFGIATSLDADPTSASHLIGTPAYLAPERLDGAPASPRSDLYSLGVVLYEALAGAKPFAGDVPVAVAHAIHEGTHRPLTEVRPDVDAGLAGVVEQAMARDPDARFPSAAAMAAALDVSDEDRTRVLPIAALSRHRSRRLALAAAVAFVSAVVLAALIGNDRTRAPARIDSPVVTTLATTVVTTPPTSPPATSSVTTAPRGGGGDKPGHGNGRGEKQND
jgi:serine/threonine protein kinase